MPHNSTKVPCWACYAKFLRRLNSGRFNFQLNEKAYLETIAMDLDRLAAKAAKSRLRPTEEEIRQASLALEESK